MTRRQAIREARACADALIEQLERKARGWDRGLYRDDDTLRAWTIPQNIRLHVNEAFRLAREFATLSK